MPDSSMPMPPSCISVPQYGQMSAPGYPAFLRCEVILPRIFSICEKMFMYNCGLTINPMPTTP